MLTIWPVQQTFQRLVRAYGQTELIQTVWISVAIMKRYVQTEVDIKPKTQKIPFVIGEKKAKISANKQ